jgi:Ion channel
MGASYHRWAGIPGLVRPPPRLVVMNDASQEPMRPGMLRRFGRTLVSANSYGLVLLLVLTSYAVGAMWTDRKATSVVLFVEIAAVWFALRVSQARPRLRKIASVLMVLAGVAAAANLFRTDAQTYRLVVVIAGVLYVLAPFSIIRHLAQRHTIDQETMLGAIAAYLLFGIAFAFVYLELGNIQADFFGNGQVPTMTQTLFFSLTTLTTTGYGNLVPAGNPGQTLAVFEMVLGQLFLITAMGKIVTEWHPRGWRPGTVGDDET